MSAKISRDLRVSVEDRLSRINLDRWAMCCEEMLIRISSGRFDDAHSVLRRFCMGEIPEYCTMSSHPSQALPARLANLLERDGYHNLMSIHYASDAELLKINHMGQESINVIRSVLQRLIKGEPVAVVTDEDFRDHLQGKVQS